MPTVTIELLSSSKKPYTMTVQIDDEWHRFWLRGKTAHLGKIYQALSTNIINIPYADIPDYYSEYKDTIFALVAFSKNDFAVLKDILSSEVNHTYKDNEALPIALQMLKEQGVAYKHVAFTKKDVTFLRKMLTSADREDLARKLNQDNKVYHPNHDTAHGLRQSHYVDFFIDMITPSPEQPPFL